MWCCICFLEIEPIELPGQKDPHLHRLTESGRMFRIVSLSFAGFSLGRWEMICTHILAIDCLTLYRISTHSLFLWPITVICNDTISPSPQRYANKSQRVLSLTPYNVLYVGDIVKINEIIFIMIFPVTIKHAISHFSDRYNCLFWWALELTPDFIYNIVEFWSNFPRNLIYMRNLNYIGIWQTRY